MNGRENHFRRSALMSAGLAVALLLGSAAPGASGLASARERANPSLVQSFTNMTQLGNGDGADAATLTIEVNGFTTPIADVDVTLFNLVHGPVSTQDLDILLIGPEGKTAMVLSDVGGNTKTNGVNLLLDDQASDQLSSNGALETGIFQPTNIGSGDTISIGGANVTPPSGAALGTFNGINPNGSWQLLVFDDDSNGNVGGIDGWRLKITTANGVPSAGADQFRTKSGKTLRVPAGGVLRNDRDPDGDALTTVLAGKPVKGSVQLAADGSFTYRAKKKAKGADSFTYLAKDPGGLNALATVSIQIKGKKSRPGK